MSTSKYPNRDALREALDIYLEAMYPFVSKYLDVDIKEEEIEEKDIAHYIRKDWEYTFKEQFKVPGKFHYYEARTVTSLIVEGRNRVSHQRLKDLEPLFTRSQLFFIAELLGEINKLDAQHKVKTLLDKLVDDAEDEIKKIAVKIERAKYQKSINEIEKRLVSEEESNKKLSQQVLDNAVKLDERKKEFEKLSNQLTDAELQVDEKEKQRKKLDRQVKNAKAGNDKLKRDLAGAKQRLEKSEAARADYEERLETKSEELERIKTDMDVSEKRLTAESNRFAALQAEKDSFEECFRSAWNLLTTAAIGDQSVFPPIETDSAVRILDRRNIEKKNYLLGLLEQKQPTIIYVQSEEMVDLLLEGVIPEKADLIEKHGKQTSEAEEAEILEKLENGELIAVVSDTTFSTLTSAHCVEHFVFCHLAPKLDEFFKQCEAAFISEKSNYLHLIYNTEQDVEGLNQWLTQKYPDKEKLRELYRELRRFAETDDGFIKPENVYNESIYNKLGMAKLGVKTGLAIFQELQFLERNEVGVKVLPDPEERDLDESKIHCDGEKLKLEIAETQAFQLKKQIEQIWEGIQERLDVGSEQMLYERDVDKTDFGISETGDSLKPIETVENGSGPDEEDTESAKEFNKKREPKPSSTETTEKDRNDIAVQVAELRINATGSRPLAWRRIREKLGLKYNQFHKGIRHSEGYRNAVIERIKSLKSAEGGWEYNGKLSVLTGIEDIENYLE